MFRPEIIKDRFSDTLRNKVNGFNFGVRDSNKSPHEICELVESPGSFLAEDLGRLDTEHS